MKTALVAGATLAIAWFAYFGLRDGMSGWAVAVGLAIIVFFVALAWRAWRPLADEQLERTLLDSGHGVAADANITAVARQGTRETEDRRETLLALTLALADGRTTRIEIACEDALLANFVTGQSVRVLQDARSPDRVALDRRASPTRIR